MRRVGKTTLLSQIQSQLLHSSPEENMIHINFESGEYIQVQDENDFWQLIKERTRNKSGKIYFFFDEIQLVNHWERVVNALRVDFDCDIYITGSNSAMLSGDLATLLAGRYVTFEIQPFTFSEFVSLHENSSKSHAELFNLFIQIGGMPSLKYFADDKEASYKYLGDIYHTVVVKDILEYHHIRDVDIFNRILTYCTQNIGHTFSAQSIRKYFLSENRKMSVDTILNYLDFCQQAYILKKVPRYDTQGKKLLTVDEKYYLTDHGFRQARGFSNQKNIDQVLENIVYIELLSRGYQITIGRVLGKEIDFIAQKDGVPRYYQVCYLMASEQTREREFAVYDEIDDNYPKYVLSMDTIDFSQRGIIHQNIIDFLLDI